MSLITELVQLFKQLDTEITDRKIRDHFIPVKEKFLELREQQFELEQLHVKQIADLKATHEAEVRELKERISSLENSSPPELILQGGMYFRQSEIGTENQSPFCTFCYENQRKAVRLLATVRGERRLCGHWKCPGCENYYSNKAASDDVVV